MVEKGRNFLQPSVPPPLFFFPFVSLLDLLLLSGLLGESQSLSNL